jgi:hypothetical protein
MELPEANCRFVRPQRSEARPFLRARGAGGPLENHPGLSTGMPVERRVRVANVFLAATFTFRLPPLIRELIARVYDLDQIELQGSGIAPQRAAGRASEGAGMAKRMERSGRPCAYRSFGTKLSAQQRPARKTTRLHKLRSDFHSIADS